MKKFITITLSILIILVLSFSQKKVLGYDVELVDEHNFNYVYNDNIVSNYYPYNELRNKLNNNSNLNIKGEVGNKTILITNSLDLYNWSHDLSYKNNNLSHQQKEVLASLNYALGKDIDYSERKSNRFMPIGYSVDGITLEFTGTFDGRGFEIFELYYAVYHEYQIEDVDNVIKVPSQYFSMFNYNKGVIKNLGLINPIIDLENEHPNLKSFSYLVGKNDSLVENVYIEDNRNKDGGIRALAAKVSIDNMKNASSLVNTNNGVFKNAYFSGYTVVNIDYEHAILEDALVYLNNGTTQNLVYDKQYKKTSLIGFKEDNLKNNSNNLDNNIFYFYPNDGYPKLFGLKQNNNQQFLIESAVELVYFTKLLKLRTNYQNISYRDHKYLLLNDINLEDVSKNAYETPNIEFNGEFSGKITNNRYPQINNLTLAEGVKVDDNIYFGLFSIITGKVENIVLYNTKIMPNDLSNFSNHNFYIGTVTGKLDDGVIKNVLVKTNINLENTNIGSYKIGSIAGQASGVVEKVYNDKTSIINIGHQENNNISNDSLYLGGIIGSTTTKKLVLYNALNEGTITNLNTSIKPTKQFNIYMGGVIGYVNNTAAIKHTIGLVTNNGLLNAGNINSNQNVNYYFAGVIGYSNGSNYEINNIYGKWTNTENFNFNNIFLSNFYVAGITNSNHNANTEFIKLYNNNYLIDENNKMISTLINHLGTGNITVSQSKSSGSYSQNNKNKNVSLVINIINSNVDLQLNYVDIDTKIIFNSSILNNELAISGITLHERTNFLNVSFEGEINVEINNTNYPVWVSGLTKVLTNNYYVKNSISDAKFDIEINTTSNLYVAGLVNRNLSGDLHNQDNSARPKASYGIINSMNNSDINILVDNKGNTFVGGVTTMNGGANGGTIQDSINTGNILVINKNNNGSATFSTSERTGGVVERFDSGVFVGGISAVVTTGYSRIFDTSNSGNIIGMANSYVRSAGILASTFRHELGSGKANLPTNYFNNTDDSINSINKSIVSNGINYGKVQAITNEIGQYSTNNNTATGQRIGIYASSGGVIGYGLSTMYRMINHGEISSTDVAGGIVGATTAWDGNRNGGGRTIVNINTAINYGDVRMIKSSKYSSIVSQKEAKLEDFYDVNHEFITPNVSNLRLRPAQKRGIGGVFGRLQRALSNQMTTNGGSFDFVVNMNPNVDLIGRLDQVYNYGSSYRFFIFINAKYYSAKVNDNTQAVFTGFHTDFTYEVHANRAIGTKTTTYTKSGNRYYKQIEYNFTTLDGAYLSKNFVNNVGGRQVNTHRNEYTDQKRFSSQKIEISSTEYPGGNRNSYVITEQINNTKNFKSSIYFEVTQSSDTATNVPIITENPNNADAVQQYVYDENFEMRDDNVILLTGEPITSYIYYAENDLLSDRFKVSRPNGMYVLSSSSGSNYGAVLPKNFIVSMFRRIKNNAPNIIDYNNVEDEYLIGEFENNISTSYKKIIDLYESLYQTKLNEKSDLLKENQLISLKDENINLTYYSNNFEYENIYFDLNRSMLSNGTNDLSFEVLNLEIPTGALIARSKNSNESLSEFQEQLLNFRNNNPNAKVATNSLAPNLNVTLNSNSSGEHYVGSFVSYSEAAIHDSAFTERYITNYNIYIRLTNTTNNLRIDSVSINNSNYQFNPNTIYTFNEKIRLNFSDSTNFLPNGYIIDDFIELYYINENNQEILVDKSYYKINSTPKTSNNFRTEFEFSKELRNGSYRLSYKFYKNDSTKSVKLNYSPTLNKDFIEFNPHTSTYYDGNKADLEFDYNLFENLGNLFTKTKLDLPDYLDNYNYEINFLNSFVKTQFFDFDEIKVEEDLINNYKVYLVHFKLNGQNLVTKEIHERKLNPTYYKEGSRINYIDYNNTTKATSFAERDDETTIFTLNYHFDNKLYNENNFYILANYQGESFEVTNNSQNIYYTFDRYLNIVMTKDALPGNYEIKIYFIRDNNDIEAGILEIEKLMNTNAYLTNIKFSQFVLGNEYPDIYVVDNNNENINNNYQPNVYYRGIDYDNADLNNENSFRINGTVARIPLNNYMPVNIVNYLPIGAKIKRKLYKQEEQYTQAVDINSSPQEIANSLSTDYTIDPETNQFSDELVYIEYLVIPESELNKPEHSQQGITYFISVVDIDHTFLGVFNFWFKENNNYKKIDDVSLFDQKLLVLNMYNYTVLNDGVELDDQSIINLNEFENIIQFNEISKINSKLNMFYYIDNNTKNNYYYGLGNNLSGYYNFSLNLPNGFKYKIYLENKDDENNLLPKFNQYIENVEGYFYYINSSSITRTRYFDVVIEKDYNSSFDWGLTDNNNPWS